MTSARSPLPVTAMIREITVEVGEQSVEVLLAYSRVGTRTAHLLDTAGGHAFRQVLTNRSGASQDNAAQNTHHLVASILAAAMQPAQLDAFGSLVPSIDDYSLAIVMLASRKQAG